MTKLLEVVTYAGIVVAVGATAWYIWLVFKDDHE